MRAALRPILRPILRDEAGSSSAEFAMVAPLFLMLIFGMLDIAGFAWRMNLTQKASQYGARVAAVTDPVAPGLTTESYVGKTYSGVTLSQGDTIPKEALGTITCTSSACSGTGASPGTIGFSSAAFNLILGRMRGIDPEITASNVTLQYRGSGLGYAGDPSGMQISPLVTVIIKNAQYKPWMGMIFKASMSLPEVRYTLTMEDGAGSKSN